MTLALAAWTTLASGENINMLVLDTEVYSNTGGQSSKSTSAGSGQLAAAGKETGKKDLLGRIAMSYGYIYVAPGGSGSRSRTVPASHAGGGRPIPVHLSSLPHCPCIEHGLKCGMGCSQQE